MHNHPSVVLYSMLFDALTEFEYILDPPNEREYSSTDLGTWSSISDAYTFLNRFNHGTNYKDGDTKLSVGNYVTIQDGTYNATWVIAGFDMEHNQTAADGTVYDNGYGICMIPVSYLQSATWNETDTLTGGYMSSTMHTTHLPTVVNNLQTVLGDHIVNRNVLLSSSVDSSNNYYSKAYTWTTSYATLMSVGQMTGEFAKYRNKYDDGEANYKLPLFNYEDYYILNHQFWTRNISGYSAESNVNFAYIIWSAYGSDGLINVGRVSEVGQSILTHYVRPLIYLR